MASLAASARGRLVDEIERLKIDLARLDAYKALAQYSLKRMGLSLDAARKQGWVSKRAEVRRRRRETKKAVELAALAKHHENSKWLREQRKKAGLPASNPTPSPSEAAYRERVAEAAEKEMARKLRKRVRRMSIQLLLAAAIGKQYREVTMADHSGHLVPGADRAVPLRYRAFDAREEADLSASDAIARAFRNWANGEKLNRFRSRSHTPETTFAESRTTGPEDTPSGSSGSIDSSFTDDSDDNNNDGAEVADGEGHAATKAHGIAFRAISNKFRLEDDDDDSTDLADLDSKDVSDEIMATAYALLAATTNVQRGHFDWADMLADDIVGGLAHWDPLIAPGSGLGLGRSWSSGVQSYNGPNGKDINKSKRPSGGKQGLDESAKFGNKLPKGVKIAHEFLRFLKQQAPSEEARAANYYIPRTEHDMYDDGNGLPERTPNKPVPPGDDVYNPSQWRVNTEDADDGAWVSKEAERCGRKKPAYQFEAGFITWDEQEAMFPYLDSRLHLHNVGGPNPVIFDPATVDSRVWDPLNRMFVEPKTGPRTPLRLNPVTTHSLARWTTLKYGIEHLLDPIRLPDHPMTEDKRRSLPSATPTTPDAAKKKMGGGLSGMASAEGRSIGENAPFVPMAMANMAVPPEMPSQPTSQETAIASVHYPLKSPSATSISKPQFKNHDDAGQSVNIATRSIANSRPRSPPTPYPRVIMPATPTVALYEHPAPPAEAITPHTARFASQEDVGLEAFFPHPKAGHTTQASSSTSSPSAPVTQIGRASSQEDNGRRPVGLSSPPTKRRRISILKADASYSSSDSGKENDAAFSFHAPSPMRAHSTVAATPKWISKGDESSDSDVEVEGMDVRVGIREWSAGPESPVTSIQALGEAQLSRAAVSGEYDGSPPQPAHGGQPHSGLKSVRFDLPPGLNGVMRREARRAIGRYQRTAERQGSLNPHGPDLHVE